MTKDISDVTRTDIVKKKDVNKKLKSGLLGKADPAKSGGKPDKGAPAPSIQDVVTLSAEYENAKKVKKWAKQAEQMPDIRPDKIKEIKEKMVNGFYDDPEVIKKTAQIIADEISSD